MSLEEKTSKVKIGGKDFLVSHFKDHIGKTLSNGNMYEGKMVNDILEMGIGGIYVDIGAFVGTHSLAFSTVADKVFSFEPYYRSYNLLNKNVDQNRIDNINTFPSAIGKAGTCSCEVVTEDNLGMNKVVNDSTGTVTVIELDTFGFKDVGLIKIDVEQTEMEVLLSAKKTIMQNKPEIFVETSSNEVFDWLRENGYKHVNEYNATPTHHFTYKHL